jgi:hypothetical protein
MKLELFVKSNTPEKSLILSIQQQQSATTPTQNTPLQQQQQSQTKERKRKRKTDNSSASVCASPSQQPLNDNQTPSNKAYKWDATASGGAGETKTNHVKKNIQDFFGKVFHFPLECVNDDPKLRVKEPNENYSVES